MMGWNGMGGWGMMSYGLGPLMLIVIAGAVILLVALPNWMSRRGPAERSPRETIDARYASGEITREQHDQMKRDLAA
jgi:putative membrane protein